MAERSSFGPRAYIVRYAWWSPVVPAAAGLVLIAGFLISGPRTPAGPGRSPGAGGWATYGARCLMALAGLYLLGLAAIYLRRAVRGRVAFAVARRGVYWCPSGDTGSGRWFSWDEVAAIEFHAAEGGSTGRGAIALCGLPPGGEPGEEPTRLVSARIGGWRIGRRRLGRALREFAPHVDLIG